MMKTVVCVGDVGSGKSLLTEKLTGERGLSSDAGSSVTRVSVAYPSLDGRMRVLDTPGMNAFTDTLQHQVWVAQAMSYRPVSMLAVVIQAGTRKDNVLRKVEEYLSNFEEFSQIITLVVTHMDKISQWSPEELETDIADAFGVTSIVYHGLDTPAATLSSAMLTQCMDHTELTINVTHANFFRYFKLKQNNRRILQTVKERLEAFDFCVEQFKKQVDAWDVEKVDLVYEFHTWCMQEIIRAQREVSEEHGFMFEGRDAANQAGYISTMSNQMKCTLKEVRYMLLGNARSADLSLNRRCPHCSLVWTKTEGCDGATICGEIPSQRDVYTTSFATFTFTYNAGTLQIGRSGTKSFAHRQFAKTGRKIGCGQSISWADMAPVTEADVEAGCWPSLVDVKDVDVTVDDVQALPVNAQRAWQTLFNTTRAGMIVAEASPVVPPTVA